MSAFLELSGLRKVFPDGTEAVRGIDLACGEAVRVRQDDDTADDCRSRDADGRYDQDVGGRHHTTAAAGA